MAPKGNSSDELAYALITPYSLHKSRTGGIIARLLWANVHLAAARMYAPSREGDFIERYCDAIYDPQEEHIPLRYQRMLIQYVAENFGRPNARGISNRMMVLVFQGPNAQQDIAEAVGHIGRDVRGDDVRGTFGDFVSPEWGESWREEAQERARKALSRYPALQKIELPERRSSFFEPGALTGVTPEMTRQHLELFQETAYSDGGFVLGALEKLDTEDVETSMVILKPESFRRRNPLPGNLVDFFARTGMYITGTKIMQLDAERARQFYESKLEQFRGQLKDMVADEARDILRKARDLAGSLDRSFDLASPPEISDLIALTRQADYLCNPPEEKGPGEVKPRVSERIYCLLQERLDDMDPSEEFFEELAEELKDLNAQAEFDELIRYMSGADAEDGAGAEGQAGTLCMALLYSGKDAVRVIRQRLRKLRDVYGQNILQNRAHASDPEEDPIREMEVLGMPSAPSGEKRPCDLERLVNDFYGRGSSAE